MLILMSFKNEFYPTVIHMSYYLHLILRANTLSWNHSKLHDLVKTISGRAVNSSKNSVVDSQKWTVFCQSWRYLIKMDGRIN